MDGIAKALAWDRYLREHGRIAYFLARYTEARDLPPDEER